MSEQRAGENEVEGRWFRAVGTLVDIVCKLASHEIPERLEDAEMWRVEAQEAAERVRLIAVERAAQGGVPDQRSLDAALVLEAVGTLGWWMFVQPGYVADVQKWGQLVTRRVEEMTTGRARC